MESITESIIRYQKTGDGFEEIVRRISIIIYNYPQKLHILTEEDQCEFYLSFYNRIEGLIKNFTFKGIPFEKLLNQTLKWHVKTYLAKLKKNRRLVAINEQEAEIRVKELLNEDEIEIENDNPPIVLKGAASRKRLLFLVLIDSHNITDSEMKSFSQMTGYDYDWLLHLKDTLNKKLFNRSERLLQLREKRNNIYFKLLYKQNSYNEEIEYEKKVIINNQIDQLKKRLDAVLLEISKVPSRPTHAEIADLLEIPKGTVDSGLYYFQKKYKSLIDKNSYSLIH